MSGEGTKAIEERAKAAAKRVKNMRQKKKTKSMEQMTDGRAFWVSALELFNLPPVNLNDAESVAARMKWYFDACSKDNVPPGVAGLANALGVTRQTIFSWANGETRTDDKRYMYMARRALSLLDAVLEVNMQTGAIDAGAAKFLGQNNFGYVNGGGESALGRTQSAPEVLSVESIQQKYIEAAAVVEDADAGETKESVGDARENAGESSNGSE